MGSIFALIVTLEAPHSLFLFFFSIRIYFIRILKLNLRNFKNKHKAEILKRV